METRLNIDAIPDGSIGKDKFTEEIKNSIDNSILPDNLKTINGESIIGEGDIVINGGSNAYLEINHGTSDTTFTLTPNTFHIWNKVTELDLSFGEETEGIANEFLFQFTSGATATTLTLPDTIKWANDEVPTVEANMIYQVSILKGLASVLKFVEDYDVYTSSYFTIVALEDGLTVKLSQNACEYRIDNGEWINLSANTATPSINKRQTLSFKGNLTPKSNSGIGTFTVNKAFNVEGNIMSLLYGDNFEGQTDLSGKDYAFYRLFYGSTKLQNVENLILPDTILAEKCYLWMFQDCTGLTTAPQLPATTLALSCYYGMFDGCTRLTEAPELPATTLADHCYNNMFSRCTSLTTAPELHATTLAESCYANMFSNCTSLTEAPELPATTLAVICYANMFSNCTSLTEAPELPATTLAGSCYTSMFSGCTSLTEAPELPATTLAKSCYQSMFIGCTSLTEAPELPATILADYCYNSMFQSCSNLNYIKMLATDIIANYCLGNWVNGVASSGTFVKNTVMTTLPSGDSGIPNGWTVENA